MILKKLYPAVALALLLSVAALSAQVRPRVAGLETDSTYMSLLGEELKLRSHEDSLVKAVASLREKLRSDRANAQSYSQSILKMENDIFEVRNNIGRIASRTSAIEQEFILNNLSGSQTPSRPAGSGQNADDVSPNLISNPYFKNNMSPEDYSALRVAEEKERVVVNYINIFGTNYEILSHIADEYIKADSAALADSLWSRYIEQKRLLAAISDSVATLNNYISDTKAYSYAMLFDLMNKSGLIEEFNNKSTQARSAEAQLKGKSESEPISAYPIRKRLTLDYEMTLAQTLGLNKALDSLRKVSNNLNSVVFDLPPIILEERFFIDYEPITVHSPSRYNASNPIPQLTIYDKGTIYRILLGSFQRAQPVSIFRGAYPIGLWKTDEGRYNYYAGGFATQAEAEEALEQMKKVGFKAPKIAMWEYGDYSLPDEEQLSQNRDAAGTLLRIYISGVKGDLSETVKNAIREAAPGKDIIRLGDKFTVGTFGNEGEAEKVAAAIRAADPVLEVSISGNPTE